MRDSLSEAMKSRIRESQDRCVNLLAKFERRIGISTNKLVARGFQKSEDGKIRASAFRQAVTALINITLTGEAVYKWLDAPDPSANHENARKEHKAGTCSWFLTGAQYTEWKHRGDSYLWVYGIRTSHISFIHLGEGLTLRFSWVRKDDYVVR